MAIVFMMAVNFGDNTAAAHAAERSLTPDTLTAGQHRLHLRHAVSRSSSTGTALTLWTDHRHQRITVTYRELNEVGHQFYDLLAPMDGYVAAACGVDADGNVFLDEITADARRLVRDGQINGLVLADTVCDSLGLDDTYVPFRPGYRWNPYRGEEPDDGLSLDSPADL